jgi:zinc protease
MIGRLSALCRTLRARPGVNTTIAGAVALLLILTPARTAQAMKIESVRSPGGIEAWLVQESAVPMMALRFAFSGGSTQDPVGKEGVSNMVAALLDEGAGDLEATAFQQRLEDIAARLSFDDGKDTFFGSFQTLTANRDKAVELLRLAVTAPRFDAAAIERIRKQVQAGIVYDERDPEKVAGRAWFEIAYPGNVYGRPASGTMASVAAIGADDLRTFHRRTLARSNLHVVAVGDITPADLGRLLDRVFGELPATADLVDIPRSQPVTGGAKRVIDMDVPQSVAFFGMGAMSRKDPDFIPAFVLNHILGGGGFASRLMTEVREKRGLAYSVYSYIQPFTHTSVFAGGVATKNEAIARSLDVIRAELTRMAAEGPSEAELRNAKDYLIGSYALRFDTNAKIATQLLGLKTDGFEKDYVEKRNGLIEAVTMDDVRRVARALLRTDNMIVTVVGKPEGMPESTRMPTPGMPATPGAAAPAPRG